MPINATLGDTKFAGELFYVQATLSGLAKYVQCLAQPLVPDYAFTRALGAAAIAAMEARKLELTVLFATGSFQINRFHAKPPI
jgi:hypothetical protein